MTRRIVEIKETGSSYFERAIFFVRMDMAQQTSEYTLSQEASRIIDRLCSDLKLTPPSRKVRALRFVKMGGCAAAGAALAVAVMMLFSL